MLVDYISSGLVSNHLTFFTTNFEKSFLVRNQYFIFVAVVYYTIVLQEELYRKVTFKYDLEK